MIYDSKAAKKALLAARRIGRADGGIPDPQAAPQPAAPLDRARSMGFQGPWYHGTERLDRLVGQGKIDPRRATSGPMPFFTDNPAIASNYAAGKSDTSLAAQDTGDVSNYFTVHPKDLGMSGRSPIPVERSWHLLPHQTRQDIAERALRVGFEDPEAEEGDFKLHPHGKHALPTSEDHYHYLVKHHRGNHLSALRELWHDSGYLIGDEHKLAKIFRLAGYPAKISQETAPWTEAKGVLPAMLRMRNPLNTTDHKYILEHVIPHLEQAFARDRSRKQAYGADQWDKNHRFTPREWTEQLKQDAAKGENSMAFTSIPDRVTEQLKALGHDAILDTGGKMGGEGHAVAIPFHPHQVRSVFAKFDPTHIDSPDIMKARGGVVERALAIARRS